MSSGTSVANDALLVQLVWGSLGQNAETRGLSRPNVSSCSFVTLHGCVRVSEERCTIEEAVRRVPGVRDVVNKMIVRSQ
ncbi:MAG: BON domain-containing protein [Actinomycetota bacterium]|nr:BON domain-containing protein [Actinomycetota bacterium]